MTGGERRLFAGVMFTACAAAIAVSVAAFALMLASVRR